MDITVFVGILAAALSCSMSIPQVVGILHTKDCAGISRGTWSIILANAVLWLVYAYLTGAYMTGVPSLINIPLSLFVLYRVSTTAHSEPTVSAGST